MDGTKKALDRYFGREAKKAAREMSGASRKNKSPEKTVVKNILKTLRSAGFCLDVVEASNYDRIKQAVVHDIKVAAGYSDISGNDKLGFAVYIEAKAPGKRSSLRELQRMFLERKIKSGAFACVSDSDVHVVELYSKWIRLKLAASELSVLKPMNMKTYDRKNPADLLLEDLPKVRRKRNATTNPEDPDDLELFLK